MSTVFSLRGTQDAMGVMRMRPTMTKSLLPLVNDLMRGESELTHGERELIATFVSARNGCDFCRVSHQYVAEVVGIPPEIALEVRNGVIPDSNPKLMALLQFAENANANAHELGDNDLRAVTDAGYTQQTVFDALAIVGLFKLFNTLMSGAGITPPNESDGRQDAIRFKESYLPPMH